MSRHTTPGSSAYGKFTDTPRHVRWPRRAAFVQDDWKVTSRLTVNLGVRWDVFASPSETQGLLSNINSWLGEQFLPTNRYRYRGAGEAALEHRLPQLCAASWRFLGSGRQENVRDPQRFQHRLQRALLEPVHQRISFGSPEANTVFAKLVVGIGTTPIPSVYTFPFQPDPDFAAPPTANGGIQGLTITPNGVDPHLRTAYAMQWFLGVQHSFAHDYGLALNYVGTRGVGGYTREDYNRFAGDICNQMALFLPKRSIELGLGADHLSFAAELTKDTPNPEVAASRMRREIERLSQSGPTLLDVTSAERGIPSFCRARWKMSYEMLSRLRRGIRVFL